MDKQSLEMKTKSRPEQLKEAFPTDSETVQDFMAEVKFLARSWLDEFEKNIFNGKTVNELLRQGGYE